MANLGIGGTFTVNTVEDGATLTAKSAIHSVGIRCTSDGKSDGSGSSAGMVTLYVDGAAVPTTYLSIKSRPSGLTVLTHAQQSVIPEGGFSISWANNVDMANLEGEVVLTVSYDSYSTEFSIPIICAKDGEDGADGKTYALKLTLPSLVIPCDSSGNSKSSGDKDCYVTFYVDGTAISTSSMTITILSKPSGLTVQTNADVSQIAKNRIYITYGSNVAKSTLEGVITFSVSDGTNTTYGGIAVMCSQDGGQGERGKIGRFFYFGGTFDSSDSTKTFIVNDAQAPYFEHSETVTTQSGTTTIKRYHVFNYDTNGTYTMAQMWAIRNNWNGKPWESMTNDFKYLITEAIFAQYAKLASAIFNGDWMLSQYGKPSMVITAQERQLVHDCVEVDGRYPVSELATLLDDEELWNEYISYGYTDNELELVADVCMWAVRAIPGSGQTYDDLRYNAIMSLSDTSYQLFGINDNNPYSVFAPNIALDFLTGVANFNKAYGYFIKPYLRITSGNIEQYRFSDTSSGIYIILPQREKNIQVEWIDSTSMEGYILLPEILEDEVGCELIITNATADQYGRTSRFDGRLLKVKGGSKEPEGIQGDPEPNRWLVDGIALSTSGNIKRVVDVPIYHEAHFRAVQLPNGSSSVGQRAWVCTGVVNLSNKTISQ